MTSGGTFHVNGGGRHVPVLPTREICHLEEDGKLGWGLNPDLDTECVDCRSYCTALAKEKKWSDGIACEAGCMQAEDKLYDEVARVHFNGACSGESEIVALVSHMV
jgi:hypothetical protein